MQPILTCLASSGSDSSLSSASFMLLLADAGIKSVLILGFACVLTKLVRHQAPAIRQSIWTVAIVSALAVPVLTVFSPNLNLSLIPRPNLSASADSAIDSASLHSIAEPARMTRLHPNTPRTHPLGDTDLSGIGINPKSSIRPSKSLAGASRDDTPETNRIQEDEYSTADHAITVGGGSGGGGSSSSTTTPRSQMLSEDYQPQSGRGIAEQAQTAHESQSVLANVAGWWRSTGVGWPTVVVALWGIGLICVVVRWGCGFWNAERMARTAIPAGPIEHDWRRVVNEISAELDIDREVRILVHADASTPMTWGMAHPVILLPTQAAAWSHERMRIVLSHEMAHIRRNDWLFQIIGWAACAVYWFNPLAWMATHRLSIDREQACDDDVIAMGTRPTDYASHLLEIARALHDQREAPCGTLAMARTSELEGRLMSILNHQTPRKQRYGFAIVPTTLSIIGLSASLAAVSIWTDPSTTATYATSATSETNPTTSTSTTAPEKAGSVSAVTSGGGSGGGVSILSSGSGRTVSSGGGAVSTTSRGGGIGVGSGSGGSVSSVGSNANVAGSGGGGGFVQTRQPDQRRSGGGGGIGVGGGSGGGHGHAGAVAGYPSHGIVGSARITGSGSSSIVDENGSVYTLRSNGGFTIRQQNGPITDIEEGTTITLREMDDTGRVFQLITTGLGDGENKYEFSISGKPAAFDKKAREWRDRTYKRFLSNDGADAADDLSRAANGQLQRLAMTESQQDSANAEQQTAIGRLNQAQTLAAFLANVQEATGDDLEPELQKSIDEFQNEIGPLLEELHRLLEELAPQAEELEIDLEEGVMALEEALQDHEIDLESLLETATVILEDGEFDEEALAEMLEHAEDIAESFEIDLSELDWEPLIAELAEIDFDTEGWDEIDLNVLGELQGMEEMDLEAISEMLSELDIDELVTGLNIQIEPMLETLMEEVELDSINEVDWEVIAEQLEQAIQSIELNEEFMAEIPQVVIEAIESLEPALIELEGLEGQFEVLESLGEQLNLQLGPIEAEIAELEQVIETEIEPLLKEIEEQFGAAEEALHTSIVKTLSRSLNEGKLEPLLQFVDEAAVIVLEEIDLTVIDGQMSISNNHDELARMVFQTLEGMAHGSKMRLRPAAEERLEAVCDQVGDTMVEFEFEFEFELDLDPELFNSDSDDEDIDEVETDEEDDDDYEYIGV